MIDWRRGGWTGSISRWVDQEIRSQLRSNPVTRRSRYPLLHRFLRCIFSSGSFLRFLLLYANFIVLVALVQVQATTNFSSIFPRWRVGYNEAAAQVLSDVPGFLIAAQIGLLGVVSLALALISLIAQRDGASIDIQVYYHESLFFGILASSLALVFVLTYQLFWPLELALRELGVGALNPSFRLFLLGSHAVWFGLNLIGILHFVSITFRFVQRSAQRKLRERYTANVILPQDLRQRLRTALYRLAGHGVWESTDEQNSRKPMIALGSTLGASYEPELMSKFRGQVRLTDVRVRLLRWALRSWCARCAVSSGSTNAGAKPIFDRTPTLWFTPTLDQPLCNDVIWCRRQGGVPLSRIERWAIRVAFRFDRDADAY